MAYRLTAAAAEDTIRIYVEGVRLFGEAQAERYQDKLEHRFGLLADNPRMGRERLELRQAIRTQPCGSHIIVYRVEENDDILIVRVRHGREDWQDDPLGDG